MKKKHLREKGKVKFSKYFQELKAGDKVAIIRELSVKSEFPTRFQGRTGTVESKRGSVYVIKMNDHNREKTLLIHPIHLKKIEAKQ